MAGQVASRDGDILVEARADRPGTGRPTSFTLNQALSDVASLTEFGVYVVGVEVVGTRGSTTGRVAITRTLLPWVPQPSDFQPDRRSAGSGHSWTPRSGWPTARSPTTRWPPTSRPADGCDRLVQAGARLGDGAAVTWAIDPDLVETVADMADENGYLVATRGDGSVPGGGGALAQQWLDRLRAATAGADVLALPYADPDLAALVHDGRPRRRRPARRHNRRRGADRAAALGERRRRHRLAGRRLPRPGHPRRPAAGRGSRPPVLDGRALPTTDRPELHPVRSGPAAVELGPGRCPARRPRAWSTCWPGPGATPPRRCWRRSGSSPRPR